MTSGFLQNITFQQEDETATLTSATTTINRRRPSPLAINEVLTRILSFLDQSTLKSIAARVSRQWFYVAQRLFRRHLYLDNLAPNSWASLHERLLQADWLTVDGTNENRVDGGDNGIKGWRRLSALIIKELWPINNKESNCNLESDQLTEDTQQQRLQKPPHLKVLHLILRSWFSAEQERDLAWFNPSGTLTELSIGLPEGAAPVQIITVLGQYPHLLHLSFYPAPGDRFQGQATRHACLCFRDIPAYDTTTSSSSKNDGSNDTVSKVTKPLVFSLRSLSIDCLPVPCQVMGNDLLPRLGNLRELSLLDIRTPADVQDETDGFHRKKPRQKFWKSLSEQCPRLEAMHFSCALVAGIRIPVRMFPLVHSWTIDSRCVTPMDITWNGIVATSIRNTITALTIVGKGLLDQNLQRDEDKVRLLHRFLCSSPQLVHLKVSGPMISPSVLWGETAGDPEVWACRSLKTLSISIGARSSPGAQKQLRAARIATFVSVSSMTIPRRVFGYLSRVCPRLADLALTMDCKLFWLESGLCLLTRLQDLERLTICTEFRFSDSFRHVNRNDFVWMQNLDNKAADIDTSSTVNTLPPLLPPPPLQSLLLPRLPVSRSMRHALSLVPSLGPSFAHVAAEVPQPGERVPLEPEIMDAVDEVKACLEAVQQLSNTYPSHARSVYDDARWSPYILDTQRLKMQERQVSNQYLTDHNRESVSIIDGLEGWEFSGCLLDMEACLQARLFRYQQQHQEEKKDGDNAEATSFSSTTSTRASAEPMSSRPWPAMRQLKLSYRGYFGEYGAASSSYQAERARWILTSLRPDIGISCVGN